MHAAYRRAVCELPPVVAQLPDMLLRALLLLVPYNRLRDPCFNSVDVCGYGVCSLPIAARRPPGDGCECGRKVPQAGPRRLDERLERGAVEWRHELGDDGAGIEEEPTAVIAARSGAQVRDSCLRKECRVRTRMSRGTPRNRVACV
jgi:hypothetical protein